MDGYHALEMESYARLDFIVTKDEKNLLSGGKYASGNDTDQPDPAGSSGSGYGLSDTV